MFHLKELVTILCLLLLVWTVIAPAGAPEILFVLPVVAFLCAVSVSQRLSGTIEFDFQPLESSLSSLTERAPPLR